MRLIFLLLLFPVYSFCQLNQSLNKDLNLRVDLVFGNKITLTGEAHFIDGYLLLQEINNHPLFDRFALIHDDQNQLREYRYMASSGKKTALNQEHILSTIEKYYGPRGKPDTSENDIVWRFIKGDEFAGFSITDSNFILQVNTNSLIKAVEKFDKDLKLHVVGVTGLVENYYDDSIIGKHNDVYQLFFKGLKEKKRY